MQQQPVPSKAVTREDSLAAPLCVLLAQLQLLAVATADSSAPPDRSREALGQNPLLVFQLASQTLRGTPVDRRNLLQDLLNPEPVLVRDLLVASLARQAVLASTVSEERSLYNWQRQQQCWLLTTNAARLLNYPDAETAGLASVFCLIEADIAQSLPVPQLWRDLQETLPLPHTDLRDTALLSRLVWCCHRLLRNQWRLDDATLTACGELLGLTELQLRTLAEQTQLTIKQRAATNGVSTGLDMLQKDSASGEHWLQELKLQAQRHLTQSAYLQSLQPPQLQTPADLQLQLQRVLLRYRLPLRFLLLAARQPNGKLEVLLNSNNDELQQEFSIPLTGSRSMLSALVQQGTIASLRLSDPGLAPVDKQLLRLLDCESALCLPLAGEQTGVLLLPDAAAYNPELTSLALNVQLLLNGFLRRGGERAQDQQVPLMQQQVREVVHEVNNPLAIIKNYLKVLQLKYPGQDARDEIGFIENEIDRITRLLQTLRHNVTASHEVIELDLGEVVRSHYKWLAAAFAGKEKLQLVYLPAAQPAVINASPAMLTQILLNLVKNAAEALGESGTITLAVKRNVHFMDKLYVLLEVSDDGPGLEAWQMQTLFQSGRTTKAGTHTGSGLAIVRKLVDGMQGQISCHSDNINDIAGTGGGKPSGNSRNKTGTTFRILLPQVR